MRKDHRLLRLIQRAQRDLERVAIELQGEPDADDVGQDIDEVRARVAALEQRVEAIETRADR